MIPGRGVFAIVSSKEVLAGNEELLKENNIVISDNTKNVTSKYINDGCTIIYVCINKQLVGFIALADTLRNESKETIRKIKETNVTPVLLTGDHKQAANAIASSLGITEVYASCLPEDKLNHIDDYQKENKHVCMVGIGSDIAVDAADIALINDKINELPHLLNLSKRMMKTIKCNLTFSMTLNFIAIILVITGILNPVVGALVHNAGSVLVIVNSAFLLNWRGK